MELKQQKDELTVKKYQEIQLGDEVFFTDTQSENFIKGIVIFKHEYVSFKEMLISEGVKNMLPFLNNDELEKGIILYQNFLGAERVKKFGCVAIGIKITGS